MKTILFVQRTRHMGNIWFTVLSCSLKNAHRHINVWQKTKMTGQQMSCCQGRPIRIGPKAWCTHVCIMVKIGVGLSKKAQIKPKKRKLNAPGCCLSPLSRSTRLLYTVSRHCFSGPTESRNENRVSDNENCPCYYYHAFISALIFLSEPTNAVSDLTAVDEDRLVSNNDKGLVVLLRRWYCFILVGSAFNCLELLFNYVPERRLFRRADFKVHIHNDLYI